MDGGSLKTTAQADKESLQAGWFSQQQLRGPVGLNLRAGDILPLIEAGRRWSSAGSKSGGLPVEMGHVSSFLRLILIAKDSKQLLVLVRTAGNTTHFPVVTTDFADNIQEGLKVSEFIKRLPNEPIIMYVVVWVQRCTQGQRCALIGTPGASSWLV